MELNNHIGTLKELVRNLGIAVNRMNKPGGDHVSPVFERARSESHVEEEEDDWRKKMEQRLSAQEGSIQHLTYNVCSMLKLMSNIFQVDQSSSGVIDDAPEQEEEHSVLVFQELQSRKSEELKKTAEDLDDFLGKVRSGGSVANDELKLDNISRATLSSLPDEVVGVTSLTSEEEEEKEEEEQAKKKQSVDSNKDVALEEMINATAADAQQQARAIAVDKQEQLCKVGEALPVLASASSVSREREEFLKLVNEKNLYRSMMDKEGTDGEQAAHEEINDSTDEHVHDGASSALINRDYDGKVTSLASATASTTRVHLEKTPTGPTPSSSSSSSSVGSSMFFTLENKPSDQPTVSSSILSSVSNSNMILVGDYQNKYNYGDLSPEEKWRSGELKKIAEDLDDFLGKVRTGGSVANYEILGFAKLHNIELTLDNISRATLSSLPDEVVGVTSLPSEEEEEKEEEEQAKKKQSVDTNKDVALEEMINATAADAQQQARAIALDKQEQLCKVSEALPVLASASKNLYCSMMDKEGTDGEQAAHEEINDSTDKHVHDAASSTLINRDYDGKVISEELASATTYLKDATAKEGIIELISELSKYKAAESMNHFPTPETTPDTDTTVDAQTSSGIQYTPGVLPDDDDEDHFPPVFEQAAESTSGVLDDNDDEDHCPPAFEQEMTEEENRRPTGVSESDVEEEEEDEDEEDSPPVIQEMKKLNKYNDILKCRTTTQEEEEQPQEVHKEPPVVRCKEKDFVKKMKALGEERKKLLEDSPFYKLFEMSGKAQNNKAIEKLVSMFNTKDRSLLLPDGSRCVVTPQDFTSIMGVEDGDEVIINRDPKIESLSEQTRMFLKKIGNYVVVCNKKIWEELTQSEDKDSVNRAFALYALQHIICPPVNNRLSLSYLKYVADVNGLKKKKWASHAIDFLVRGIHTYKSGRGIGRKILSGCTVFLLLYVRKKISDTIPEEMPEPRRTKMIDKKLDELLKMCNKERTDVFEIAPLVKDIMRQRNESLIAALEKAQKNCLSKVKNKKAKDILEKDGEDVMFEFVSMLDAKMATIDSILECGARIEEEGISQKWKEENELEKDPVEGKRKKTVGKVIEPKHAMQTQTQQTRKPVGD